MATAKIKGDSGMLGLLPKWVHVAVLAASIVAVAATTKADVGHLDTRMIELEQRGSPAIRERLAHIETAQVDQAITMREIDQHLNSIDESLRRSR